MKQVYNEKKNFSSWSADEVYYWAINILKDEDVDGLVLSNLNDPEMKGLNVKFRTKIKLWEGIKNIQK